MRTLFVPLYRVAHVVMRKFLVPQYCELIKKYKITFSVLVANQIYEILETEYFKTFIKKGLVSASAKLFLKLKVN